jgi:PAS domain S-box-containing protein
MRKRAEEDLVKSEQRWATTLSSIGDGVIATDMNGQVTFMNQVAENLTGWTYLESGAKPINDIFVIINEFSRQKADNPVDKVLAQGITCNLANHTILLRRDGIQVPIDDGASPIKDQAGKMTGVVLIFRDISQRKMTEKALRESEENYRQLFNNMSEGFAHCEMIFDPDGRPIDYRFLNANPRTAEFTGCSADKIIGKTILSIFPHVSPGAIENFGRVISTGQPVHFENYSLDLKRWFDVYAFKAGPAQFAYMLINITERKQAEEALKISNEELTRFNRVSVGRELRMIELKQEINALSIRCGLKPPYPFSSEEE